MRGLIGRQLGATSRRYTDIPEKIVWQVLSELPSQTRLTPHCPRAAGVSGLEDRRGLPLADAAAHGRGTLLHGAFRVP